jgi:DNA polymerase III delta prime subunit
MRVARCDCQTVLHSDYLLAKAQIPGLYQNKDLSNFKTDGAQHLLEPLLFKARGFVDRYPIEKKGLLITGPSGTGKTHLAIGIIKELVLNKGVQCLFCDYSELLSQIRNSYNSSSQETEMALLRPVFKSDVVVLDDLGSSRATDWVWETVSCRRPGTESCEVHSRRHLRGPHWGSHAVPHTRNVPNSPRTRNRKGLSQRKEQKSVILIPNNRAIFLGV